MASLANQTISSTYDGLVKTSTDQPVPISGVQLLEDGVGNSLALSVGRANQGVTITGTLTATSISGVLADGVTATTQTLGDNSTKVATTAYVDAQVTASDLDFAGDSGTGAVDLDSQSLTIAGTANEIETVASGQTITIGLPSSVTVGTLTATTLAGTLSTAAQPNITSVGTLSSLAVSGATTLSGGVSGDTAFSGNLTIGSVSVGKNINTYSSAYGSNGVHSFYGTDNNLKFQIGGLSNDLSFLYSPSGVGMTFYTGALERMRIDSSGNVGIGTSSPLTGGGNASWLTLEGSTYSGGVIMSVSNVAKGYLYYDDTGEVTLQGGTGVDVKVVTGGAEAMRIDSSGRVGIGTSSPSRELEVTGAGNVYLKVSAQTDDDSAILELANTQNSWTIFNTDTANDNLEFNSSTVTDVLVLQKTGNVGIGTSSPAEKLSVNGNVILNSGYKIWGNNNGGSTSSYLSIYNATDGGIDLMANFGTSKITFGTAGSEKMRITSTGNVGIGTSSPAANLEVLDPVSGNFQGAIRVGGSGSGRRLVLKQDSATEYSIGGTGDSSITKFVSAGAFGVGLERMRIDANGNILIGKTSKNTTTNGIQLQNDNTISSVSEGVGYFYNKSNGGSGTAFLIRSGDTNVGSISVTASSTAYNTSSDYRLKENVVPMEGALDRVDALKPSRFNFIADADKTVDGFLAHEVAEVVPEAVSGEKDAVDEEGNPVYQGVDYSKVVPVLTAAIQELSAKIKELESKLNG